MNHYQIIFGASKLGEIALHKLNNRFNIKYFCDNDPKKWGSTFKGLTVISPNELGSMKDTHDIIIASTYNKEITLQLFELGIFEFIVFSIKNEPECALPAVDHALFYMDRKNIVLNYETTDCLCCGSDSYTDVYEDYNIVKCCNCGLVYVRKRRSKEDTDYYYEKLYIRNAKLGNYINVATPENEYNHNSPFWQGMVNESERFSDHIMDIYTKYSHKNIDKNNFKYIELGCGWGKYLIGLKNAGINPSGYELGKDNVEFAKSIELNVSSKDYMDVEGNDESVDFFYLSHVFEHLRQPKEILLKFYKDLKKDGLIYIIVPNFDSLWHEQKGRDWEWLDPVGHLTYFNNDTLTKMVESAGFSVKSIETSMDIKFLDMDKLIASEVNISLDEAQINEKIRMLNAENKGESLIIIAKK